MAVVGLWDVGKGRCSRLARWKPTLQPLRQQELRVLRSQSEAGVWCDGGPSEDLQSDGPGFRCTSCYLCNLGQGAFPSQAAVSVALG